MADVTSKRQGELVRGLLTILVDHPDGMPARDAIARLADRVPPTSYESADWPKEPGVRRFEKIVRFSTIGPVKAGWLAKTAGTWSVTPLGVDALKRYPDPAQLMREVARLYREWRKANPKGDAAAAGADVDGAAEASVDLAAFNVEEAKESAWEQVRAYLGAMPPYDFQELVAGLLKAMGYHIAWVSPPGADGGIDVLAHTDPLGAAGPRIKVQVKRIDGKVSADNLRSFMAVVGDQDVGIYVALGGFTSGAASEARRQEKRKLTLIDAFKLYQLWVQYQNRVPEEYRQLLPLTPIYYLDRR